MNTYNYDWDYKVVYADEIVLNETEQQKLEGLKKIKVFAVQK